MNKIKCCLVIMLWMVSPIMSSAVDLELSDVIKEARAQQMKIAKSQNEEQTKSDYKQDEKNAAETISNEEIKKSQKIIIPKKD